MTEADYLWMAGIAAAVVATLVIAVLITRPLPTVGRWLARGVIALGAVVVAGLILVAPPGQLGAPTSAPAPAQQAERQVDQDTVERDARVRADEERQRAEVAKQRDGASGGGTASESSGAIATLPQSPPATAQPERGEQSSDLGPTRSATPVTPGGEWDVVPVFYGTDRNRSQETADRIVYGVERAKRLELGRALVTVPKVHQVPEIERPWVYKLPFTRIVVYEEPEDPAKHFTLRRVQAMTEAEFLAVIRERLRVSSRFKDHALVFVHGYQTSFDYALYRTAQVAYDLKFDGAPFVYSWPSKAKLVSYSYDRESAGQAEPYLKQFLELVARSSGAKTVSVIAHSMGNQLLLPVLRSLKDSLPEGVKLAQVILAAPDVDRDGFEFLAGQIKGVSAGVTMYANANDRALEASRQFWGGVPRAGDVPESGPVIVAGVDTIDVTAAASSTDIFALNHSGYAENKALLNDIQLLLQTGERPPDKRVPILQRVTTPNGSYWKYPARN
ncbi:MAG: alpha/beta hydrolase [Pseudomonadota bacterium]